MYYIDLIGGKQHSQVLHITKPFILLFKPENGPYHEIIKVLYDEIYIQSLDVSIRERTELNMRFMLGSQAGKHDDLVFSSHRELAGYLILVFMPARFNTREAQEQYHEQIWLRFIKALLDLKIIDEKGYENLKKTTYYPVFYGYIDNISATIGNQTAHFNLRATGLTSYALDRSNIGDKGWNVILHSFVTVKTNKMIYGDLSDLPIVPIYMRGKCDWKKIFEVLGARLAVGLLNLLGAITFTSLAASNPLIGVIVSLIVHLTVTLINRIPGIGEMISALFMLPADVLAYLTLWAIHLIQVISAKESGNPRRFVTFVLGGEADFDMWTRDLQKAFPDLYKRSPHTWESYMNYLDQIKRVFQNFFEILKIHTKFMMRAITSDDYNTLFEWYYNQLTKVMLNSGLVLSMVKLDIFKGQTWWKTLYNSLQLSGRTIIEEAEPFTFVWETGEMNTVNFKELITTLANGMALVRFPSNIGLMDPREYYGAIARDSQHPLRYEYELNANYINYRENLTLRGIPTDYFTQNSLWLWIIWMKVIGFGFHIFIQRRSFFIPMIVRFKETVNRMLSYLAAFGSALAGLNHFIARYSDNWDKRLLINVDYAKTLPEFGNIYYLRVKSLEKLLDAYKVTLTIPYTPHLRPYRPIIFYVPRFKLERDGRVVIDYQKFKGWITSVRIEYSPTRASTILHVTKVRPIAQFELPQVKMPYTCPKRARKALKLYYAKHGWSGMPQFASEKEILEYLELAETEQTTIPWSKLPPQYIYAAGRWTDVCRGNVITSTNPKCNLVYWKLVDGKLQITDKSDEADVIVYQYVHDQIYDKLARIKFMKVEKTGGAYVLIVEKWPDEMINTKQCELWVQQFYSCPQTISRGSYLGLDGIYIQKPKLSER